MAWGAGTYPEGVYNKEIPGTYINIKVNNYDYGNSSERGYLACPIELPWGTDDDIIKITAEDYMLNCFTTFGYNPGAPELVFIEEMLKNASTLYLYRLNGGGGKAKGTLGTARCSGALGNKITVVIEPNENDETFCNVRTFVDSVEVDTQIVEKTGQDTITLTKGQEKNGETIETANATFTFQDNQITVQFSNVPEGYKPSVRVKGQVGGVLGFVPGRFEDTETSNGNKHVISYYNGAPTNGTMTVEACLTKDKITVLKSCTYTCTVNEDAETGVDPDDVKDNAFVEFKRDGLLKVNGGDVFKGGSDKKVSEASHQAARDMFENVDFNILAVPTTDMDEQDRYIEYVKTLRDEGIKFQIVLPEVFRPTPINYEGVIEYSNEVTNPVVDAKADLCYWLAGAEAGCKVQNSCTAKVYDGVFDISAKVTRDQQSKAIRGGKILFHTVGDDKVILKDINTLTTISKEDQGSKSKDFSSNQVVRVLDGITVETASIFNSYFLGKKANTSGQRAELRNQLLKVREHYEQINAIDTYDASQLVILPGQKANEVIGRDAIRPLQAMDTLYFQITFLNE